MTPVPAITRDPPRSRRSSRVTLSHRRWPAAVECRGPQRGLAQVFSRDSGASRSPVLPACPAALPDEPASRRSDLLYTVCSAWLSRPLGTPSCWAAPAWRIHRPVQHSGSRTLAPSRLRLLLSRSRDDLRRSRQAGLPMGPAVGAIRDYQLIGLCMSL